MNRTVLPLSSEKLKNDEHSSEERGIGKQMLLVDIIHAENDIVTAGGTSFLSTKKFAKYANIEEDEAEKFIKTVNSLLLGEIAVSAAKKVCKKKDNSYMWLMDTFGYWGEVILKILDAESVIRFFDTTAKPNYDRYMKKWGKIYPVEESFGMVDTFASAMICYMDHFVSTVNEVLDQGYSWPVVSKMLGGKMDKSKFINLEDIVEELKQG